MTTEIAQDDYYGRAERMVNRAYDMFPCGKPEHVEKPFPMYSYERAANQFWYAFTAELFKQGLNEDEVEWLLRSKHMRWMFDGEPDFAPLVKELITPNMIKTARIETAAEKGEQVQT